MRTLSCGTWRRRTAPGHPSTINTPLATFTSPLLPYQLWLCSSRAAEQLWRLQPLLWPPVASGSQPVLGKSQPQGMKATYLPFALKRGWPAQSRGEPPNYKPDLLAFSGDFYKFQIRTLVGIFLISYQLMRYACFFLF